LQKPFHRSELADALTIILDCVVKDT